MIKSALVSWIKIDLHYTFFQRGTTICFCKGARHDEWWVKSKWIPIYVICEGGLVYVLCSIYPCTRNMRCGAFRGRGGVMKVSVLYLVTQSRGQFRLPVFFSPELGRPAACRLQASPVSTYMQSAVLQLACSEGAEIRVGTVSLSSETLDTSAFCLSGKLLAFG